MAISYGIEAHEADPDGAEPQAPVRYVVLIDSAASGGRLARLFLADRTQVAEFGAASPEVQQLTDGLLAEPGAAGSEWALALAGHAPGERAGAEVYTLAV